MDSMLKIEGVDEVDAKILLTIGRGVLKQVRFSCAVDVGLIKILNSSVSKVKKLNELDVVYDAFYDDVVSSFTGNSEKMEWSCDMVDHIFRYIGTYGVSPLGLDVTLVEFRTLRHFLKNSSTRYKHGG